MANSFSEKYKDPRWQKKRLEILQRDNFSCSQCGDKKSMLSIHHGYYTRDFNPWDYSESTLHTVCKKCHEEFEEIKHDVHIQLAKLSIKELKKIFINHLQNG